MHRTGGAGVAAAGDAEIFAYRLSGDLAAGIEDPLDDGGVDIGHIAFEYLRADHHRHAGEAYVILESDPPASELASWFALDRGLHVPGAICVLLRRWPIELTARIFDCGQLVRSCVQCCIGI